MRIFLRIFVRILMRIFSTIELPPWNPFRGVEFSLAAAAAAASGFFFRVTLGLLLRLMVF